LRRLLTHGVRGPNAAMQVVHRIFDEVRAFGASEEQSVSRAEQRRKDEEKRELISANLDRPDLIEWSVHILGPDEVHPCRSRAEAEALAYETNILAGETNKGRGDDEFVSYAAYVVPRFKADKEAEQRRKNAESEDAVRQYQTPDGRWEDVVNDEIWGMAIAANAKRRVLYSRPANVAALEARVKELEGALGEIAANKTSDCPNASSRLYQDQLAWAVEWCRRKARAAIREGADR